MKKVKLKEKMTFYEVESFLKTHQQVSLLTLEEMKKIPEETATYWLPETYSEFSSFGFIWDGDKTAKTKEKKIEKHFVLIKIP